MLVASRILLNQLALDDTPVIEAETRYPSPASLWQAFRLPYWPPPFVPDLYRPLTTILLHGQRFVGHGQPWVFHLVSLVLAGLVAGLLTYWLAPRVGQPAAIAAGTLFAVHPLHSEAVAEAVNQADLMVALIAIVAIGLYGRLRRRGDLGPRALLGLVGLQWLAAGFKESGVLLPLMLAAQECVLLVDARPWRERLRTMRPVLLAFALSTIGFVALRGAILGNLRGSFVAPIFLDQPLGVRALTMLGAVPELTRLLFWPAHLRIDYSVGEFVAATGWSTAQSAGAVLLLLATALLAFSWRRAPPAAFGLLLAGIAFAPMHNVLVPTGVLIAERTLYLPSAGVAIAVAVLLQHLGTTAGPGRLTMLLVIVLSCVGAARSIERFGVWRDQRTLWTRALEDSPNSWQTNATNAAFAELDGKLGTAERLLRRSIELWPRHLDARLSLAFLYRQYGRCERARGLFLAILYEVPSHFPARLGLVTCELYAGDYAVARWAAIQGAPYNNPLFRTLARTADSALRVRAPAGTVQPADSLLNRVTSEARAALLVRTP